MAIAALGGRVVRRGVPAHPGSMLWLARIGRTAILGLPTCGAYSKATAADLLLPRLLSGEDRPRRTVAKLGHGGILTRSQRFRFPAYARELDAPTVAHDWLVNPAGRRVDSADDRPRAPTSRHALNRGDPGGLPQPRLHRRPVAGDRRVPGPRARAAAAPRGRGRASARPSWPRSSRHRSGTRLIRLQCYEGLDVNTAVYEWNYPRQMLEIRLLEARGEADQATAHDIFGPDFLIRRPLLQALESTDGAAPVLLIDEIDRADEEFEAYLLEILSDFQVTVPEIGTIRAEIPPRVILTSNRTREVHDALKRRCLYHWIDYPTAQKEYEIVLARVPACAGAARARGRRLRPSPARGGPDQGSGDRRDARLGGGAPARSARASWTPELVDETLGVVLKYEEDIRQVRGDQTRADTCRGRRAGLTKTSMTDPAIVRSPFGPEVDGRRLLGEAVGFGRSLRAARLSIDLGAAVDFARALTLVDIADREQVKAAGAAVFVRRRDDRAIYDAAFDALVAPARPVPAARPSSRQPASDDDTARRTRRRRRRPRPRQARTAATLQTGGARHAHPHRGDDEARRGRRSTASSSRPTPIRRARSSGIASSTG